MNNKLATQLKEGTVEYFKVMYTHLSKRKKIIILGQVSWFPGRDSNKPISVRKSKNVKFESPCLIILQNAA